VRPPDRKSEKAEKELEKAEADKVKAETDRDAAKTELSKLEETAREHTLRDDRFGALGAGFLAALGDKTKDRLKSQAGKFSDEEWTARLDELEELTSKKRDDGAANGGSDAGKDEFSADEIAAFKGGQGEPNHDKKPQESVRRSVLAGL
jgi:hypothetical protein